MFFLELKFRGYPVDIQLSGYFNILLSGWSAVPSDPDYWNSTTVGIDLRKSSIMRTTKALLAPLDSQICKTQNVF